MRLRSLFVAVLVIATATWVLAASARGRPSHHSHPGCGRFCHNAGGVGGGPGGPPAPKLALLTRQVRLRGRTISLPLACRAKYACRGALLADVRQPKGSSFFVGIGRWDLFVPAQQEWIVELRLTSKGAALISTRHRVQVVILAQFHSKMHFLERELDVTVLG